MNKNKILKLKATKTSLYYAFLLHLSNHPLSTLSSSLYSAIYIPRLLQKKKNYENQKQNMK